MNKKGFTLVELLAVIVIIGILSIMVIPNVIKTRNDYLEKTFESRLKLINNAALDWASENLVNVPSNVTNEYNGQKVFDSNCTKTCPTCGYITVGFLIENNYLSGSDENKTVMKNPLTNENLNNKKVCVRYNNNDIFTRKLISFIEE